VKQHKIKQYMIILRIIKLKMIAKKPPFIKALKYVID